MTHAYSNAEQIAQRNQARLGINPSSGAATTGAATREIEHAKSMAGATTAARTTAETEGFEKLKSAVTHLGVGG